MSNSRWRGRLILMNSTRLGKNAMKIMFMDRRKKWRKQHIHSYRKHSYRYLHNIHNLYIYIYIILISYIIYRTYTQYIYIYINSQRSFFSQNKSHITSITRAPVPHSIAARPGTSLHRCDPTPKLLHFGKWQVVVTNNASDLRFLEIWCFRFSWEKWSVQICCWQKLPVWGLVCKKATPSFWGYLVSTNNVCMKKHTFQKT